MGVLPLESVIGFDGKVTGGLVLHPDGRTLIYPLGATVVVKELGDTFAQTFLQGHTDEVSCLTVSPDGRYLASAFLKSSLRPSSATACTLHQTGPRDSSHVPSGRVNPRAHYPVRVHVPSRSETPHSTRRTARFASSKRERVGETLYLTFIEAGGRWRSGERGTAGGWCRSATMARTSTDGTGRRGT